MKRRDAIVIAIALVAFLAFWVVSSAVEASAYEHVTGKHVSTFDAMFVDLRVTAAVQEVR